MLKVKNKKPSSSPSPALWFGVLSPVAQALSYSSVPPGFTVEQEGQQLSRTSSLRTHCLGFPSIPSGQELSEFVSDQESNGLMTLCCFVLVFCVCGVFCWRFNLLCLFILR